MRQRARTSCSRAPQPCAPCAPRGGAASASSSPTAASTSSTSATCEASSRRAARRSPRRRAQHGRERASPEGARPPGRARAPARRGRGGARLRRLGAALRRSDAARRDPRAAARTCSRRAATGRSTRSWDARRSRAGAGAWCDCARCRESARRRIVDAGARARTRAEPARCSQGRIGLRLEGPCTRGASAAALRAEAAARRGRPRRGRPAGAARRACSSRCSPAATCSSRAFPGSPRRRPCARSRRRSGSASAASSSRRTCCRATSSARRSIAPTSTASRCARARSSRRSCSPTRSTARRPRCSRRCSRRWRSGRSRSATRASRLPRPFFVMATQNPIEHEGTYPLPEAQVDRFLLKLVVGYPSDDGGARDRRARRADAACVRRVADADSVAALHARRRRGPRAPMRCATTRCASCARRREPTARGRQPSPGSAAPPRGSRRRRRLAPRESLPACAPPVRGRCSTGATSRRPST